MLTATARQACRLALTCAGDYLHEMISQAAPPPRSRNRFPVRDHQVLSAVLGKLGSTRLANNLNQLARAANLSALDVTPEVEANLRQACADVAEMRSMLIKALGLGTNLSPPEEP